MHAPVPSPLLQAHQDVVESLRRHVAALAQASRAGSIFAQEAEEVHDWAMRELDRMEGLGRDWEAECDRFAGLLNECNGELFRAGG